MAPTTHPMLIPNCMMSWVVEAICIAPMDMMCQCNSSRLMVAQRKISEAVTRLSSEPALPDSLASHPTAAADAIHDLTEIRLDNELERARSLSRQYSSNDDADDDDDDNDDDPIESSVRAANKQIQWAAKSVHDSLMEGETRIYKRVANMIDEYTKGQHVLDWQAVQLHKGQDASLKKYFQSNGYSGMGNQRKRQNLYFSIKVAEFVRDDLQDLLLVLSFHLKSFRKLEVTAEKCEKTSPSVYEETVAHIKSWIGEKLKDHPRIFREAHTSKKRRYETNQNANEMDQVNTDGVDQNLLEMYQETATSSVDLSNHYWMDQCIPFGTGTNANAMTSNLPSVMFNFNEPLDA